MHRNENECIRVGYMIASIFVPPELPNLSTWSATSTIPRVGNCIYACCGFMSQGLRLQRKGDFVWCLEGKHQKKSRFTISRPISCLIRLAVFVKGKSPGRRPVTEAQMDEFLAAFVRSSCKSIRHAVRQLKMPYTTVHKVVRKCLEFRSDRYQLLSYATAKGKEVSYSFCCVTWSRRTFYSLNLLHRWSHVPFVGEC
jgi:hypothetical protein